MKRKEARMAALIAEMSAEDGSDGTGERAPPGSGPPESGPPDSGPPESGPPEKDGTAPAPEGPAPPGTTNVEPSLRFRWPAAAAVAGLLAVAAWLLLRGGDEPVPATVAASAKVATPASSGAVVLTEASYQQLIDDAGLALEAELAPLRERTVETHEDRVILQAYLSPTGPLITRATTSALEKHGVTSMALGWFAKASPHIVTRGRAKLAEQAKAALATQLGGGDLPRLADTPEGCLKLVERVMVERGREPRLDTTLFALLAPCGASLPRHALECIRRSRSLDSYRQCEERKVAAAASTAAAASAAAAAASADPTLPPWHP